MGRDKFYSSLARHAYWHKMHDDVGSFVASCRECQKNKLPREKTAGMLQSLDVPRKCWEEVTADFVSKFPKSPRGHDMVLVIVDRLSKRAIFVPTNENICAMDATALFHDHLFSKHGVPIRLVSDRDPKFKSKYWTGLK